MSEGRYLAAFAKHPAQRRGIDGTVSLVENNSQLDKLNHSHTFATARTPPFAAFASESLADYITHGTKDGHANNGSLQRRLSAFMVSGATQLARTS